MAPTWTQRAYKATEPMWQKIFDHPFIAEMCDGSLPDEKLRYYFEQNLHYIDAVVRCRCIAAGKADSAEVRDFFLDPAPVIVGELKHQQKMVTELGGRTDAPLSPTCHAYTRHLLTLSWSRDPVEYFGAFLPCPWTYDEIGKRIKDKLKDEAQRDWWQFYLSPEHNQMCERYRAMVDKLADKLSEERQAQMIENFRTTLRYEYRFWQMAYTMETWDI